MTKAVICFTSLLCLVYIFCSSVVNIGALEILAPFFLNGGEHSKPLVVEIEIDAAGKDADDEEVEGRIDCCAELDEDEEDDEDDEDEEDEEDEEEDDVFPFETFFTFDCVEALRTIFKFNVQCYD